MSAAYIGKCYKVDVSLATYTGGCYKIDLSPAAYTGRCYRIDLSPATNMCMCVSGGGTIIPEAGVISGGVCTAMSPLTSGTQLELEVGYSKQHNICKYFFRHKVHRKINIDISLIPPLLFCPENIVCFLHLLHILKCTSD